MNRLASLLPEGYNLSKEATQNAALAILQTAAQATYKAEMAFKEASRVLADCHAMLAALENVPDENGTTAITVANYYLNVNNTAAVTGDTNLIVGSNINDICSWYASWEKYVALECVQDDSLNDSGSDDPLSGNHYPSNHDSSKLEPPPPSFATSRSMFPPFGYDGVMETKSSYGQVPVQGVSGAVSSTNSSNNALASAPSTFETPRYPLSHHDLAVPEPEVLTVIDPHPVCYKHYVVLVGREPGVFKSYQGIESNVDGILNSVIREFDEAPIAYEVYLQALRAKEVVRVTDSDGKLSYEVVEDDEEELEEKGFDRQNLDG